MNSFAVSSLKEFNDAIFKINEISKQKSNSKTVPLWYRGHEQASYHLLPSILRVSAPDDLNPSVKFMQNRNKSYNTNNAKEEYRYQAIRSRAYHKVHSMPESQYEWEEIKQHYYMKTRLLDWSESAIIALIFALNPLISNYENQDFCKRRNDISPCIWVLDPKKLNEQVYDVFCNNTEGTFPLIEKALTGMHFKQNIKLLANNIGTEMQKNKSLYLGKGDDDPFISGLVSLSVLNFMRMEAQSQFDTLIETSAFNPYFFLLLRYHLDGVGVPAGSLPPVASIHPYHSSRIEDQKGAFTSFPNYIINEKTDDIRLSGMDICSMEMQEKADDYLYKIRLLNPYRIAEDLLVMGERYTSVYSEIEQYAVDLEAAKFHF